MLTRYKMHCREALDLYLNWGLNLSRNWRFQNMFWPTARRDQNTNFKKKGFYFKTLPWFNVPFLTWILWVSQASWLVRIVTYIVEGNVAPSYRPMNIKRTACNHLVSCDIRRCFLHRVLLSVTDASRIQNRKWNQRSCWTQNPGF